MRCKHVRLIIDEEWVSTIQTIVRDGKLDIDGVQTDGNPTGHYRFQCSACLMDKMFTDQNAPKWAMKYIEKIKHADDDEEETSG